MSTLQQRAAAVLQKINDLLAEWEKVTPGPWRKVNSNVWNQHRLTVASCPLTNFYTPLSQHENNASFIATSRALCPASLRANAKAIEALVADKMWNTLTAILDELETSLKP